MKTINFLNKLKKEKRLEMVKSSEEMKQFYLEKSESNLISSKVLLDINRLEEATSLAYYSSYHALQALLFGIGIKSENHTASIILLNKIFGIDNSFIMFAKKERLDKQYYVDFEITKEQVIDLIQKVEEFRGDLYDFISKLTNEKIGFYRNKFISLLNIKK